jgi:hypothetical protein
MHGATSYSLEISLPQNSVRLECAPADDAQFKAGSVWVAGTMRERAEGQGEETWRGG